MDLYIHSPIRLHGVLLKFGEHRDKLYLYLTCQSVVWLTFFYKTDTFDFNLTLSRGYALFFPLALPAHSGPRPVIQFRNHFSQTVWLLGRVISPSQGRNLNTGQHKHRINAYTPQTSMPWVGFEPMTRASEQAKTVPALDRAATVAGGVMLYIYVYKEEVHRPIRI
jgi:hypothetical protein